PAVRGADRGARRRRQGARDPAGARGARPSRLHREDQGGQRRGDARARRAVPEPRGGGEGACAPQVARLRGQRCTALTHLAARMTAFDYVVLAIVGLSLVVSVWRGAVREIMALAAWVLAFLAS